MSERTQQQRVVEVEGAGGRSQLAEDSLLLGDVHADAVNGLYEAAF